MSRNAVAPAALLAPRARPRVMGIVNVTPDSFSDGGEHEDPDAAVEHGRTLLAAGADLLDVGGESTRPGATRPLVAEESARVLPVISRLAEEGARVSVDTMRAEVARAAVEAGATVVNDVSGGLADATMAATVAGLDVTYVTMHWRAHGDRMDDFARYDGSGGVVGGVYEELAGRLEALTAAGVDPERVVLDPGLGFAKTPEQNWELLRSLDRLAPLGRPLLLGASRKRFLGDLLADDDGAPRPVGQRVHADVALAGWLAGQDVWGLRVHDVAAVTDGLAVLDRLR